MALRNIVQDGDPILKKVCRPVTKFDGRLAEMLDDMKETMLEANGLGLAAPQIGVMRRVFIALDESEMPDNKMLDEEAAEEPGEVQEIAPKIIECVNPEILEQRGEVEGSEGCLSYPGEYGMVIRPEWVKVRAFDRHGEPFIVEGTGILARCLCHESNHLDGITLPDLVEYYYDEELEESDEEPQN